MKKFFTAFYESDKVYKDLMRMGLLEAAKGSRMAKFFGKKLLFSERLFTNGSPINQINIHVLKHLLFCSMGNGNLEKVVDYHLSFCNESVSLEKRKNIEEFLMKHTPIL